VISKAEISMRSKKNYDAPDLSALTATIAHSQIVATLAAAQRFPTGFDGRDVAILRWIAAESCNAKRSYP